MRKIGWFMIFLLVTLAVVITLGATDYQGFGSWMGNAIQGSVVAPIRNWIVDGWLWAGTSGWYILAVALGISIFGAVFWVPICYGLIWKKGIQQKVLHKTGTPTLTAPLQRTLTTTITTPEPVMVPTTTVTPTITPVVEEKKESA